MPACSALSSSSASERIIPSETLPRSFARSSVRPSGSTAPGARPRPSRPRRSSTRRRRSGAARPRPRRRGRAGGGRRSGACRPRRPARRGSGVVAVLVGDPAIGDALDLAGGDGEAVGDLGRRRVDVDVLAEPGDGDLHRQNCLRTRRSFSQSSPSAGRPWRSMATRSRPMPNEAASTPRGRARRTRTARVDHARAGDLDPARVPAHRAAAPVAEESSSSGSRDGSVKGSRACGSASRAPRRRARIMWSSVPLRSLAIVDPAVDRKPLDLVEDRRVSRVGRVAPVDAAERDHVDRRGWDSMTRIWDGEVSVRKEDVAVQEDRLQRERDGWSTGKLSASKL